MNVPLASYEPASAFFLHTNSLKPEFSFMPVFVALSNAVAANYSATVLDSAIKSWYWTVNISMQEARFFV